MKNNACKRISKNREAIEQKPTSMDREPVEDLSARQKVSRWIENLSKSDRDKVQKFWWIEIAITFVETSRWIEIVITFVETRRKKGLDRLKVVEWYREAVEMLKNSFSKKRKAQIWMQSNMLLNQISKQYFKLSKTSLNKKNVKHLDSKHTHTHTHTHTHKKSLTNFIFQKQVKTHTH